MGILLSAAALLSVAACASPAAKPTEPSSSPASPVLASAATSLARVTSTVWLCRPGKAGDPCAYSRQATVVPARGARTHENAPINGRSAFDCFYVYPTVSRERSDTADLKVQRAEIDVAAEQASRFSQVCRVWAPIYRQRTDVSLLKGLGADPRGDAIAYRSVLSAWRDYLAHYNHGRPVVLIGDSQGAAMLIRLLASQVDPSPALRARTVVAILAGGNVVVPSGRTVGGSFRHLPLCTHKAETGCVIAYSAFPSEPPGDAEVGRPGQGVSLQAGQTATKGVQVACVNPASIGGRRGDLDPYFLAVTSTPPPPRVTTPWVSYPHLYLASCRHAGGAGWLQVKAVTVAGRPVVSELLGPAWGYHADDINLALGSLVEDVAAEEAAYSHRH